jgi:hypothetical protein
VEAGRLFDLEVRWKRKSRLHWLHKWLFTVAKVAVWGQIGSVLSCVRLSQFSDGRERSSSRSARGMMNLWSSGSVRVGVVAGK